jgi:hypothetical protein
MTLVEAQNMFLQWLERAVFLLTRWRFVAIT